MKDLEENILQNVHDLRGTTAQNQAIGAVALAILYLAKVLREK